MSSRLQDHIDDLTGAEGLYERITLLVWEKEAATEDESGHAKLSHSPFPGSSKHWGWLTTVRAGTRHAEGDLEIWLGYSHVYRSDSDANTHASLARLPVLVEARPGVCPREGLDDDGAPQRHGLQCAGVGYTPHVVEAVVSRWWSAARELLEIDEPWSRIPEPKGEPVVCSVCGNRSLRWRPKARTMICVYPTCRQTWGPEDMEWLANNTFEAS